MKVEIVRVFWRDQVNPFPGRLVAVKRVKLSRSECAWRDFVRRQTEERDRREWAQWQRDAARFEALADEACGEAL